MDINYLWDVFFGKPPPSIPNLRMGLDEVLPFYGLVRGTLVIGKPGSGKTRFIAWLTVLYMLKFPDRGILILDASGALKKDILAIALLLSEKERMSILRRLIIDIPFNGEYVHSMPEFHRDYGVSYEKQIQRVADNFRKLNPKTMELAMLGKPTFEEMITELFRLLCAIRNDAGENWQITEAKKLLTDGSQLAMALNQFGGRVPEAKWYFEQFTKMKVDDREREMRSYTLRSALGVIEPREMRARLGGYKPSWTIEELDKRGLCAIVSGERMLDQEPQMNYIFSQVYSLFRQEMNKRLPDDPKDKPFLFMIDEAPVLYRVPGMAQELGELSTFYRSRKLELVIIIQALWQVTKEMQGQLWSLGNKVVFSLEDMDDASSIAEHLFYYASTMVKPEPNNRAGSRPISPVRQLVAFASRTRLCGQKLQEPV
jgi:hypothetical protein